VSAFQPGHMSADSFAQLTQAEQNAYDDWHPPVISGLWSISLLLTNSLIPILILQITLVILSSFYILTTYLGITASILLTATITALPSTLGYIGVLGKDSFFGACLLGAFAFAQSASNAAPKKSFYLKIGVSFLLGLLALASRHNSMPAILFLFLFWTLEFYKRSQQPNKGIKLRAKQVLIAFFLLYLTYGLKLFIENTLLLTARTHPEQQVMLFDLVGMKSKGADIQIPTPFTKFLSNEEKLPQQF
jgi:hypothetical protein